MAETELFRLQTSVPISETSRILQAKFGWPEARALEACDVILSFADFVNAHIELDVITRDPDDNRILECSQASRSDYIVTGDRDLIEIGQYAGARIIKAADFLSLL